MPPDGDEQQNAQDQRIRDMCDAIVRGMARFEAGGGSYTEIVKKHRAAVDEVFRRDNAFRRRWSWKNEDVE